MPEDRAMRLDQRLTDIQLLSTTHGKGSFIEDTLMMNGFTLQPGEEAIIVVSARIAALRLGEAIPHVAVLESPDASVHVGSLTLLGDHPFPTDASASYGVVIPGQLPATGEPPVWRGLVVGLGLGGLLVSGLFVYCHRHV